VLGGGDNFRKAQCSSCRWKKTKGKEKNNYIKYFFLKGTLISISEDVLYKVF
jgi:hypothetical protein